MADATRSAAGATIEARREGEPLAFTVVVRDRGGETRHRVTMAAQDWARWRSQCDAPERCLEAAFAFLIAREPKEAILARFDFAVIAHYFPEFEAEFPAVLAGLRRSRESTQ